MFAIRSCSRRLAPNKRERTKQGVKPREHNFMVEPNIALRDRSFGVCLQGGRVTPASGLTLPGGQKTAWVYKQNFPAGKTRQNLMRGYTQRVWKQKGYPFRRVTLPGVFTREKVNPPAMVTLALSTL